MEIVPGISAAFGAAAGARISLTDRRVASHVLFTTYSRSESRTLPGIGLTSETTVVVYMPGPDYSGASRWLQEAGLPGETPCRVISKATQREQSMAATTLQGLKKLIALPAPALLLVGRVAAPFCEETDAFGWLEQGHAESWSKESVS
jgi:siroheme synthase